MCKKQTSVSHSSTESEMIFLDTGLRLDGLLALELWDLIVSVLGKVSRVSDQSGKLAKTVNGLFIRGMSLKTNLMQNYSDNSVTANAVYCHRRGV